MTDINTALKTPQQRKAEALEACFYSDGETFYRVLYALDEKRDSNADVIHVLNDYADESFSILNEDTGDEHVIAYSEIPPEAYFLKLVRI